VTGERRERLVRAIINVHDSGHSVGAATYRNGRGLAGPTRMGVVVQQLVSADLSLLAFSVHPVTRTPGVVIEA